MQGLVQCITRPFDDIAMLRNLPHRLSSKWMANIKIAMAGNKRRTKVSNQVARKFSDNFPLIEKCTVEVSKQEQIFLLSPNVLTIAIDPGGTFAYQGIEEFFSGILAWSRHFHFQSQPRLEYLEETSKRVFVKMHGDIDFIAPINGLVCSRADDQPLV
jgi:hypothetical protein